ncbi:hypothetical protein [Kordia sp.]|uniref:hypothetical protein n=1 Tax=Kordia sp. TaxID=1965332 RepID=UPI003D6C4F59
MNTTDKNYFYALLKLLTEFDRAVETDSYENVRTMINHIGANISFQESEKLFMEVANYLSAVRYYDLGKITLQTHLKNDLNMSQMAKKLMRAPLNRIIEKFGGGTWVRNSDCIACEKVSDCVELIKSKLP